MKAIILAAGRATRLYPITLRKPKCLLEIGNKTILEYQIQILKEYGINGIVIVVGYRANQIKKLGKDSVKYIYFPSYAKRNNLHSLWQAANEIKNCEFVCIYGDVLFHREIFKRCLSSKKDICLVIDRNVVEETMKVKIENDHIKEVNKSIPLDQADGNFIGICKFSAKGSKLLIQEMSELVGQGNPDAYFTLAIERLITKGYEVQFCSTEGYFWIDIDTRDDFEIAKGQASLLT